MYAGYIKIFDLGKLSKSLKNKNLDQPLALKHEKEGSREGRPAGGGRSRTKCHHK